MHSIAGGSNYRLPEIALELGLCDMCESNVALVELYLPFCTKAKQSTSLVCLELTWDLES